MAKILLSTEEQKYLADRDYLKKDLKRLGSEKIKLENEISSVAKKVSDIKDNQIVLEKKAKEIIENAERDAKGLRDSAKNIERKASEERTETGKKLSEALNRQREADSLVKSNEGKERNLLFEKSEVDKIKSKLLTIVKMIKNEVG